MSEAEETDRLEAEFPIDRSGLYLEEVFTDIQNGAVKRYTPVKPDGSVDKSRAVLYVGQTLIASEQGSFPLRAEIRAKDLAQAFKRYPETMALALRNLIAEAQRASAQPQSPIIQTPESRIIVP